MVPHEYSLLLVGVGTISTCCRPDFEVISSLVSSLFISQYFHAKMIFRVQAWALTGNTTTREAGAVFASHMTYSPRPSP